MGSSLLCLWFNGSIRGPCSSRNVLLRLGRACLPREGGAQMRFRLARVPSDGIALAEGGPAGFALGEGAVRRNRACRGRACWVRAWRGCRQTESHLQRVNLLNFRLQRANLLDYRLQRVIPPSASDFPAGSPSASAISAPPSPSHFPAGATVSGAASHELDVHSRRIPHEEEAH